MDQWFEKTSGHSRDELVFLQSAYWDTFFENEKGRQVLCHLLANIDEILRDGDISAEQRIGVIMLRRMILANCGVYDNAVALNALACGGRTALPLPKKASDHLKIQDESKSPLTIRDTTKQE